MVSSKTKTVEDYPENLPQDRLDWVAKVRDVILGNLPDGYVEAARA